SGPGISDRESNFLPGQEPREWPLRLGKLLIPSGLNVRPVLQHADSVGTTNRVPAMGNADARDLKAIPASGGRRGGGGRAECRVGVAGLCARVNGIAKVATRTAGVGRTAPN